MTSKQFGINHALFGLKDYKAYTKRRAAFGDAFSRTKLLKLEDQIHEQIENGCICNENRSNNVNVKEQSTEGHFQLSIPCRTG